jgi:uncharacterized membrane protein
MYNDEESIACGPRRVATGSDVLGAQRDFVSKNPADLAALAITLLAATRLSMLPTVVIGVASAAVLRWLMG